MISFLILLFIVIIELLALSILLFSVYVVGSVLVFVIVFLGVLIFILVPAFFAGNIFLFIANLFFYFFSSIPILIIIFLASMLIRIDYKNRKIVHISLSNKKIKCLVLKSWIQKRVGFLNHLTQPVDYGILLLNTKKISTYGMFFNLDIVFISKDYKVLDIKTNIPPNIIVSAVPKTKHVLEFPCGLINYSLLGQKIEIQH